VDKETKLLTGGGVQYMSLPPLTLKGIDGPVEVFTPMDSKMKETVRSTDLAERYLVDEHAQLTKMILTGNNAVTLVLTGDRGSGKSILVDVRDAVLFFVCLIKKLTNFLSFRQAVGTIGKENDMTVLTGHTKPRSRTKSKSSEAIGIASADVLDGPTFSAWQGFFFWRFLFRRKKYQS
jgi:hypothetical protein